MKTGWIRAYSDENDSLNSSSPYQWRFKRALFRKKFKAEIKKTKSITSDTLIKVKWGKNVVLPNGLSKQKWSAIIYRGKKGFILTKHVVQVGYIKRKKGTKNDFTARMITSSNKKKNLLWGDTVQITSKVADGNNYKIRCRGVSGKIDKDFIGDISLLETYFIDVAQGDGVLVKTPDNKHLVIDGGLERKSQQTGKNAVDFIDWKFFFDYGHFEIDLDSMVASHADTDHFGGLHDFVRGNLLSQRELDCIKVNINTFYHPGLSRWTKNPTATVSHKDGLGSQKDGFFIQLLTDRNSAEQATNGNSPEQLSNPWKKFISDILSNSSKTKVKLLIVEQEELKAGKKLPELFVGDDYTIKVLGPVSKRIDGEKGLKDLGDKGKNSNGHSVCLRVDYHSARILLTGDLNKKSMDWLRESYGDRMSQWASDVVKACHHGSDDISYRFLEEIKAGATIISSGDAEGHAHPRPEIVSASALTGYQSIDRNSDKLITPLVYMTEIERSVSLGALNQIKIKNLPSNEGSAKINKTILTRNLDELTKTIRDRIPDKVKEMEKAMESEAIEVDFDISVPLVPFGNRNATKRAWRSKVMEKNHYGLVNVRTDGETIMCATLNETGKKWIIHSFPARF